MGGLRQQKAFELKSGLIFRIPWLRRVPKVPLGFGATGLGVKGFGALGLPVAVQGLAG